MNREERIKAALNLKDVDRVPVSIWMHFSQFDQDPVSLAEKLVDFNEEYDYDFIKMMPFGAYTTSDWGAKLSIYCDKYKEVVVSKPGINCVEDYYKIEPLAATYGTWGKTLQVAQHINKLVKSNTPYIQTIFSPMTTLKKLSYGDLAKDMIEHPDAVHAALKAITETTINFVKANIEAGVHGFFFATQNATYDSMTDLLFAEFCKPYDLQVMNSYVNETYFNVVHIHGSNIMFDAVKNYPCNCLNWHDRHTAPDLKTARTLTEKAFLGGILEVPTITKTGLSYHSILANSTPAQLEQHIKEAINAVGGKGLILGPGCVADPKVTSENLHAVRKAVE